MNVPSSPVQACRIAGSTPSLSISFRAKPLMSSVCPAVLMELARSTSTARMPTRASCMATIGPAIPAPTMRTRAIADRVRLREAMKQTKKERAASWRGWHRPRVRVASADPDISEVACDATHRCVKLRLSLSTSSHHFGVHCLNRRVRRAVAFVSDVHASSAPSYATQSMTCSIISSSPVPTSPSCAAASS